MKRLIARMGLDVRDALPTRTDLAVIGILAAVMSVTCAVIFAPALLVCFIAPAYGEAALLVNIALVGLGVWVANAWARR